MILRKRRKRKTARALDTLAGVTKIWAELQIGKKAGQGVAKVKKAKLPWLKSKRVRAVGAMALAGAVVAAVGKKMKADPADSYSGPAPSEAVEAAAKAPDPPPLAVAPDPDPDAAAIPAAGSAALRDSDDNDGKPDGPAAGSAALLDDTTAAEPAPADMPPPPPDPEPAAAAEPGPIAEEEPEKPAT